VKGTALTQDQVNLLARFTPMISLCFDTDGAGQEAFKRSLPLLEKKGITASVVVLTKGKDADEEIQKDPVAFRKAVKHATPAYDFLLSQTITKFDAKTAEGKQAIAKTLLPLFADIENEIVKEHYLHELSSAIDASVEVLNKEIDKLRKKEVITSHAATTQVSRPRGELLEEYFTALFVQSDNPKMLFEKTKEFFGSYAWHTLVYEKILIRLQEFVAQKNYDNKQFVAGLPQELLSAFDSCFLLPLPKLDMETLISEAEKISSQLLTTYIKEQITKIGEAIQEKEKKQETDGIAALEEKLSRFTKLLAKKD
ncbi:MAG: toprim domain-containing protein, partial [Candidatus Levyibacteriota bacterium]